MTRRLWLLALGLAPAGLDLALSALGWTSDVQIVSGTLPDGDPDLAILRALVAIGVHAVAWCVSPPVVAGALAAMVLAVARPASPADGGDH